MLIFKNIIKTFFTLLTIFLFLGGIFWVCYKIVNFIISIFKTLNPNVVAAIVVASATIIASTITIVLGRYFEAKRERVAVHRDKKIDLYDKFLEKLFVFFLGNDEEKKEINLVSFLKENHRKLILWSSPNVIKTYTEWSALLSASPNNPKAKSMIKMMDLYLALRKDLGHSNKGINHGHLIRFMLKRPELFMRMFKQNPEVTFAEISIEESKYEDSK